MRRLIAVLAASALLLSSVGSVGAATPTKLAKGQRVVISTSRNVVLGGKAWATLKVTRCDRTQFKNYSATVTMFGSTLTMQRVGVVKNGSSSSKACVWRASIKVPMSATLGANIASFSVLGLPGTVTLASTTKTITVRAPEASGGTDHSGGSDKSGGS